MSFEQQIPYSQYQPSQPQSYQIQYTQPTQQYTTTNYVTSTMLPNPYLSTSQINVPSNNYQYEDTVKRSKVETNPYTTNLQASSNFGGENASEPARFQNLLTTSYNMNSIGGNSSGTQGLLTPNRTNDPLKSSNVKILTPNRSPLGCKIVFGASPTKKQLQDEIDAHHMRALTQSQQNQQSLGLLKETIQFLNSTNSSPEKRQTAKSLLVSMNGDQLQSQQQYQSYTQY